MKRTIAIVTLAVLGLMTARSCHRTATAAISAGYRDGNDKRNRTRKRQAPTGTSDLPAP